MVTPTDIKYAQRLRGLRLAKDIKQPQAAELLGLGSQQAYSKLENGQTAFTDEIIAGICRSFDISPEDFTSSVSSFSITNSPNAAANNNSPHGVANDISLIQTALTAKQDAIDALKQLIASYEKQLAEKDEHIQALERGPKQ